MAHLNTVDFEQVASLNFTKAIIRGEESETIMQIKSISIIKERDLYLITTNRDKTFLVPCSLCVLAEE